MSTRLRPVLLASLLACLALAPGAAGEDRPSVLELAIGDPARKDQDVELVLDGISDSRAGETITPAELARRLADVRLLLIGETHTNADFHAVQLRVIEELHRAGRQVMLGLEMYPYTEQRFLDQWSRGLLTEEGFLELSDWYEHWGYPWAYYREIFLFAREHGLRIHALNTPRDVVRAVRMKGFENLTEEQRHHVPERIDTDSDEHLLLFKAIFEEDADSDFHAALPEAQLRAMFDAQCTWDATMGHNAVRALEGHDDPGTILVVMVGAGHLAYDLGIQRQIRRSFAGRVASVIPIPVADECETIDRVRASYADFVWGVPGEGAPLYPYLGISTSEDAESGGRKVIYVAPDSPAAEAGFETGDLLVSMDGTPLPDRATLMRLVAGKSWGDAAAFVVTRAGEQRDLPVLFRRARPELCDEAEDGGADDEATEAEG